jgi:hypothetical protein
MGANLITSLQEIRDFRTSRGRRYPLWLILLLVIMGTISGCRSYYALEDFGTGHYQAVSEKLGLEVTRLPSDTTMRSHFTETRFSNFGAAVRAMGKQCI